MRTFNIPLIVMCGRTMTNVVISEEACSWDIQRYQLVIKGQHFTIASEPYRDPNLAEKHLIPRMRKMIYSLSLVQDVPIDLELTGGLPVHRML